MTRANTLLFALFALVLLSALAPNAAHAQTPDGVTPSLEEACDLEFGAAFGLCNAYCEAMDCHLANDQDETTSPSASATACAKVEYRFVQITGRLGVEIAAGERGSRPQVRSPTGGIQRVD